ncbi:MAG: hypothetical protein MUF01_04925 [Bryobacterales bacterium]|jgi:hypothetical protein|nr:hypothetical protein [Bryobacterales bacterium]
METPYVDLLRVAWRLWWRHAVLVGLMAALLLGPFAMVGLRYPILWEAMAASDVAKPLFFVPAYLGMNLLVCYPMAVGWLSRSVHGKPVRSVPSYQARSLAGGKGTTARRAQHRQTFVLSWRVFWIPFLWDCANIALGWGLVFARPEHPKLPVALAAIAVNTTLVNLLAMLPLNVRRVGVATWREGEAAGNAAHSQLNE